MTITRVSIDDTLPAVLGPDEHPLTVGAVRNLSALRSVAIALDHVVNRSQDSVRKYGAIDPGDAKANADDLADARRHLRTLEAGLAAGHAMVDAVEAQVNPKPEAKKNGKDK